MGISFSEIFLIFLVALIFFGAESIPGVARTLGKLVAEFKKATEDVKREIGDSPLNDIKRDINEVRDNITGQVSDLKNSVVNDTNEVKQNLRDNVVTPLQEAQKAAEVDVDASIKAAKTNTSGNAANEQHTV